MNPLTAILVLAFIGMIYAIIQRVCADEPPPNGQKYHDTWKDYWKELEDAQKEREKERRKK